MEKFKKLSIPYRIWMIVLVLLPLLMMIVLSFLDINGFDFSSSHFTFENFHDLVNHTYFKAIGISLFYSAVATLGCLVLGYPIALIISKLKTSNKTIILFILILPMWTNMLLRIRAMEMLSLPNGFMKNTFKLSFNFYGTPFAVIFGMIVMYLPFMILPIYTVLEKIDPLLIEASKDLGANNFRTFWKVTFPLSLKGVVSGVVMVFLPAAMGFTISEILGAGRIQMIGNIIENFFKKANIYNLGSLISLIIIFLVIGSLLIISKIDSEGETIL